jgi:DAACS family dicarboxylate/amino acid:cation (Na+ or H+) symporter
MAKKRKSKVDPYKIFIGLIVGSLLGLLAHSFADTSPELIAGIRTYVAKPIGDIFLGMLFMLVLPIMITSIALGVARLGSIEKFRSLGGRTVTYMVLTTTLAITIGIGFANIFKPGAGFDPTAKDQLIEEYKDLAASKTSKTIVHKPWNPNFYVQIVPRNIVKSLVDSRMLSIIFISILLGLMMLHLGEEKTKALREVMQAIMDGTIWLIGLIMKTAPYAVAALIFVTVSLMGSQIFALLGKYIGVVCLGYLAHYFISYPILLKYLIGQKIGDFYRNMLPVISTAFSTSSSNATLPTTLVTAQDSFKVPKHISGFTLPFGATVNMDGTALFEVTAALFIAQVFGIDLSLGSQILVGLLVVLSSVGVAGIPGGSIPLLMIVMSSVGIPEIGIALILGPDRILDMLRTVVNVTGDMTTCLFVNKAEGKKARA